MAQLGKLEAGVQIKCSPDKFYNFFKANMGQLAKIFPNDILSYETIQGQDGCVGNVKVLKCDIGNGCPMTMKQRTLAVDDGARSISFEIIEGDIKKLYNTYKYTYSVTDDCRVTWSIDFEKAYDSAPDPHAYSSFATTVVKGLDKYLQDQ